MLGNKTAYILALSIALGACVKKRPEVEQQGANIDNLLEVSQYDGLRCSLETTDTIIKQNDRNTEAEKVKGHHDDIKFLNVVDFTSDCPFLVENKQELQFRGEPNTTYNIEFRVEPNNLVAYKVVTDEEISHIEQTFSTRSKKQNRWLVPIGGFEVQSFNNVEFRRNANNKDTNEKIKTEVAKFEHEQAKYFAINTRAFKRFEQAQEKVDILPTSYFDGEWYFQRTVAKIRFGSNNLIGQGSSEARDHSGRFVNAGRIKFEIRQNYIYGVSTTIDPRLQEQQAKQLEQDNLNSVISVSIPGELVSYRRDTDGENLELKEVEINAGLDGEYFKTKFVEIATDDDKGSNVLAELTKIGLVGKMQNELKSIKILDDYFEVVVERGNTGQLVRYAFRKITDKSTYSEKIAFNTDMQKFGYFFSERHQILDERTAREEDITRRTLVSRFNPEKNIVYHFTNATSTDEWVRNVGREAINIWQQAFEKAGLPISISLDESSDKDIGDIRYNLLNIITDDTGNGGGYGPSFVDPLNGEIISAISNIYTADYRDVFYQVLRSYIAEELNYQAELNTLGQSTALSPMISQLDTVLRHNFLKEDEYGNVVSGSSYQWRDPEYQRGLVYKPMVSDADIDGYKVVDASGWHREVNSFSDLYRTLNNQAKTKNVSSVGLTTNSELQRSNLLAMVEPYSLIDESGIETYGPHAAGAIAFAKERCPEIDRFVGQLKQQNRIPSTPEENEVIGPCVLGLMKLKVLSSLVHEIGHNLGLRHNFMGSVDGHNFHKEDSYQARFIDINTPYTDKVLTASVMDYVPWQTYAQIGPGGYDIAALRFGYGNQVEMADVNAETLPPVGTGTMKTLDPSISIEENLAQADSSAQLRDFLYCTDTNARSLKTDPWCAVHDYGETAVEIVKYDADRAVKSINRLLLRADKIGIPSSVTAFGTFSRMKEFYDEWRVVVAEYAGIKRQYLQGMTTAEYANLVNDILNDPDKGERNRDLFKARNIFVNLALDYAFLPNKYCQVQNEFGELQLLELDLIKQELQALRVQGKVASCSDTVVTNFLERNDYKLVKEFGYFLEGGTQFIDPKRIVEKMDYSGVAPLRINAFSMLTQRYSPSVYNRSVTGFTPNVIDEPDVRSVVLNLLLNRTLNGVSIQSREIDLDDYATLKLLTKQNVEARIGGEGPFLNFDKESDIVIAMFQSYIQGLSVPGDTQESIMRQSTLTFGRTNSPSQVKDVAKEFYQVSSNLFIYITSTDSVAKSILDKARSLRAQSQVVGLSESDFKVETFESLKAPVFNNLKDYLPLDGTFTVGDLLILSEVIPQFVQSVTESNPALAQLLTQLFSAEMNFFGQQVMPIIAKQMADIGLPMNQKTQELLGQVATNPQAEVSGLDESQVRALKGLINNDIIASLKVAGIQPVTSQAILDERIDQFMEASKENFMEQVEIGLNYEKNKDELDAQIDLLQQLMLVNAR